MIERGIQFGKIHSYHDLNLILSAVEIPPAQPQTNFVEIPGRNDPIDLTEVHGEVKFTARDCKFTFSMHPNYGLTDEDFEEKKMEVSNLLNGRRFNITVDKDPEYYFQGRCSIDEYQSDRRLRKIVVSAKVNPYKLKQCETVLKYDLPPIPQTVNIVNDRMTVSPVFECSESGAKVVFDGVSYTLNKGSQKVLDILFKEGVNQLKISGSGTLIIRFQEGAL